MPYIINSKESPRFEDDTLFWYYGNTFSLFFNVTLLNDDGSNVVIEPTDRITTRFYRRGKEMVHEFVATGLVTKTDSNGNQYVEVELDFTDEISRKFDVAKYTYCMTYYGTDITTIAADLNAEVEKCH